MCVDVCEKADLHFYVNLHTHKNYVFRNQRNRINVVNYRKIINGMYNEGFIVLFVVIVVGVF